MKKTITLLIFLIGAGINQVRSAEILYSVLADGCGGCHGTKGVSAPHMPTIAGLNKDYLRTVMLQYKTGERSSTIMGRLARGYTDAQIDALASYFAAQTWVSPFQEVNERLLKRGEKIHREKCEMCHKDNGRYMNAETPRLAGQAIAHLRIVLDEYRDEERRVMKKYMKKLMRKIRSRDVEALANFYANQR
uniref:Cytochrome subunit of sulfide dehydrogenase n=1 Tax=Candidatus Kentrum sp. TUN TaxID=2126343 RepID=A0A450ZH64_9GAMM|nr:MAG: cytochrome subunit of sulfide dehydrogenase [Candidatus Kentron sp. TUN]VFK52598.1 MAG: cytochrome subunit of sulfide dehydrogenase [Candidatus Kentron sp. TUN]VFK53097.1 MAG: cytochrome subunit of sulfide dehydrogenase [Candidatus Kentron sp. TUN]